MNDNLGLTRNSLIKIVKRHLDRNADVLMGVDDPEVNQAINVLIEGFALAIEKNNKQISEDLKSMARKQSFFQ